MPEINFVYHSKVCRQPNINFGETYFTDIRAMLPSTAKLLRI